MVKDCCLLMVAYVGIYSPSFSNKDNQQEDMMSSTGKFEVTLEPQKDGDAPAGRMIINKTYSGDLVGTGVGQMISKRTASGPAVYYAIEEFTGKVNGSSGSFTLIHKGFMSKESQSLEVVILDGSGEGELEGINGSMDIVQDDAGHTYELNYKL